MAYTKEQLQGLHEIELKDICKKLKIVSSGKKSQIIKRILEEITPDLNINKKSLSALCRNPFAIDIIQRYKHSIKYTELAKNSNERAIEMIKIHLSIPTLSKHYREGILKKLVENDRAGWLVLELFSKGEYSNLDYVYTAKILTKPYIFCPDI